MRIESRRLLYYKSIYIKAFRFFNITGTTDGFVFQNRSADFDYVNSFTEEISRKHTNEDRIRYA